VSAESDARTLADIRSWRANRHPQSPTTVTLSIPDIDVLLRIADERDQLRRDLCQEQEGRDRRRPTNHTNGGL
jgi:hypothetical protein